MSTTTPMYTNLNTHATCFFGTNEKQLLDLVSTIIQQQQIHQVDTLQILNERIGIADIKVVQRFLSNKPFASPAKLVVLAAWQLTVVAQQTLLKVLEEPPSHSLIVLLTQNEQELLPTIVSRCQVIRLQAVTHFPMMFDSDRIYWEALLKKGIGERFKETPLLTKDREESLAWLAQQIIFFRSTLLNYYETGVTPFSLTASEICHILKSLIYARRLTSQNVNTKLVIDHLFLWLPTRKN